MTKEEGQKAFTETWRIMRKYEDMRFNDDDWWQAFIKDIDALPEQYERGSDNELLRRHLVVGLANYFVDLSRQQQKEAEYVH